MAVCFSIELNNMYLDMYEMNKQNKREYVY